MASWKSGASNHVVINLSVVTSAQALAVNVFKVAPIRLAPKTVQFLCFVTICAHYLVVKFATLAISLVTTGASTVNVVRSVETLAHLARKGVSESACTKSAPNPAVKYATCPLVRSLALRS